MNEHRLSIFGKNTYKINKPVGYPCKQFVSSALTYIKLGLPSREADTDACGRLLSG